MKNISQFLILLILFTVSLQFEQQSSIKVIRKQPARKERKLQVAAGMMGAVGGLAAGALLGSLFGDGEKEMNELQKLKLDLMLENGMNIHGSLDRRNSIHSIASTGMRVNKELIDFEREAMGIVSEMKMAINNVGQTQTRHINEVFKSGRI